MLIKWCKIQCLNLERALVFPRNQDICLKNWKLWRAPATVEFNFNYVKFFLLKICTRFRPTNIYKRVWDFLKFCLDIELLINLVSVCKNQVFFDFGKQQVLNKIKKIPHTLLWKLAIRKRVQDFNKIIKVYGSWSLSKFSIFLVKYLVSRKRLGFNRPSSNISQKSGILFEEFNTLTSSNYHRV